MLACVALQACATAGDPVAPVQDPTPASIAALVSAQVPLVPRAELHALTRVTPWHCTNYDEASRTCEMVSRTEWRDPDHGTARMTVLARERPREVLVLTLPVQVHGDLECGRVAELTVQIVSDRGVPGHRSDDVQAATRRSLKRPFICHGLVRDGANFRPVVHRDGRSTPDDITLRLFTEPPALRLRDRRV